MRKDPMPRARVQDVVLIQRFQHLSPGHADDGGKRREAERDGRQDHVPERLCCDIGPPCEQRVNGDQAGDHLRARRHDAKPPAQGEEIKPQRQIPLQHEHEPKPEYRQSNTGNRQRADGLVRQLVVIDCAQHAKRHTQDDGEPDGHKTHLKRDGEEARDVVQDQSSGQQRGTQITGCKVPDVITKANDQRLFQAPIQPDHLDQFGAGIRSDGRSCRVTGRDTGNDKDDRHEPDQHESYSHKTTEDQAAQRVSSF